MQNIEEIYKEYFEIVNKYLFCLTHNNDISEELTQETFYKAVRKIKTFKGQCKLSVWLCQIAKNLWYNELKKRKRIFLTTDEEEMLLLKNEKNTEDIVIEKDENETKMIEKTEGETRVVENSIIAIKPTLYSLNGFWKELIDSIFYKIDIGYCNGKECYIINNGKDIKQYVDKDTGVLLRIIQDSEEHYTVSNYEFEFGQIKDGEIEEKINDLR